MSSHVTLIIPDNLFTRAKRLTQMKKDKSTDELVDVLDQILASVAETAADLDEEEWLDEDPAVTREMQAYIALHPTLKKSHFGQHVAVYNEKLIDADADYDTLTRRIDAQYPDRFVWITTVAEDPIQTFIFRSPRLEEAG